MSFIRGTRIVTTSNWNKISNIGSGKIINLTNSFRMLSTIDSSLTMKITYQNLNSTCSNSLQSQSQRSCRRLMTTKPTPSSPTTNSVKVESGFEDLDKPIQFTTSKAASWTAQNSLGGNQEMPWFQPFIIVGSVAVFLIYFCILREESDIDENMSLSLWERIPGLEYQQLQVILKYNIDHGLPTEDIVKRIKELEEIREKEFSGRKP